MPLSHKEEHGQDKYLVGYKFCHTREVSVTLLPIETIVAAVGKSDPVFDLQADIMFGGYELRKIFKFRQESELICLCCTDMPAKGCEICLTP